MNAALTFRLDPSPAPASSAGSSSQRSLFGTNDLPTPSITAAESMRKCIAGALDEARVPVAQRDAYLRYLCEGRLVEPELVLWLGAPRRGERWLDLFVNETDTTQPVLERARRLLAYSRAMRRWPRGALKALRRQRLSSGAFELATLPPLPPALRALRAVLLPIAMETRALLYQSFALPTRIERDGAVRTVEVLQSFRLQFDFARKAIAIERLEKSGWISEPTHDADLLAPLPTDEWCICFAYNVRQSLRVAMGKAWDGAGLADAALAWIVAVTRRLSERSRLLDRVRESIRNAYPCDRQLMADICACTIRLKYGQSLTTRAYVSWWAIAPILRLRVRDSAGLAPIWALAVRTGLMGVGDDYDTLQQVLQKYGITPAGWNLLARYPHLLFFPFRQATTDPAEAFPGVCSYLRLLQRAQSRRLLPFLLARALFAPHWFAKGLDVENLPLGLIRGAAERTRALPPLESEAFVEHELVPVLGWLARAKPVLDTNQQRAPLAWFLERYRQWSELERRRREARRWAHGIDGMRWRRFDVVPVRDSATLWIEGEQMRTCVNAYANDCASGAYVLYSVRSPGKPRPYAHIGLSIDAQGAVLVDQVRGFANSKVEPALAAFATRLVRLSHANVAR